MKQSKSKHANMALDTDSIHQIESAVLKCVESLLEPPFYVVAIDFEKEFGRWYLRLYIDIQVNPQPTDTTVATQVTLKNCETLSRLLDPAIETLSELKDLAYNLEISSPGLNRVLKTAREFGFYTNRRIRLNLQDGIPEDRLPLPFREGFLRGFDAETKTLYLSLETISEKVTLAFDPALLSVELNPKHTLALDVESDTEQGIEPGTKPGIELDAEPETEQETEQETSTRINVE